MCEYCAFHLRNQHLRFRLCFLLLTNTCFSWQRVVWLEQVGRVFTIMWWRNTDAHTGLHQSPTWSRGRAVPRGDQPDSDVQSGDLPRLGFNRKLYQGAIIWTYNGLKIGKQCTNYTTNRTTHLVVLNAMYMHIVDVRVVNLCWIFVPECPALIRPSRSRLTCNTTDLHTVCILTCDAGKPFRRIKYLIFSLLYIIK